jgi:hypothetical protein
MFDKSRQFTIGGGKFKTSGNNYDWQRNPNFGRCMYLFQLQRVSAPLTSSFPITAEMFANSSGHTINDGEFTATGNSSGFANTSGYVINGGTFVAASSSTHQASTYHRASVNYGTSQGNAPPRPYQQQGKSERFCSTSCQAHVVAFRLLRFQNFLPR